MFPLRSWLASIATVAVAASAHAQGAPRVDYHQHLFSPELASLISNGQPAPQLDAANLIRLLDDAGIERAVVLSTAYIWTQPSRHIADAAQHMRAENDWTSRQVAQFPTRLIGFCSLNPLSDDALAELARCKTDPHLRSGLKIHIGNSVVDYHNREHVARLQRVFREANAARMAIVVHMRASVTEKLPYGREEAAIFLNDVVSAAPDVPIQIAHLSGAGGYDDPAIDPALSVFVDAIQRADPHTKNLWFDVTAVVDAAQSAELKAQIAQRVRAIGVQRVLYGTDAPIGGVTPKTGWAAFRTLPLTADEFATIAANVAPYAVPQAR
ncbi:MAG: amidohydrolase family protein [Vicinamibacterales bacterium]